MQSYLRARPRNAACFGPRPQPRPLGHLSRPASCRAPQPASASALPARTPPLPPPSTSASSFPVSLPDQSSSQSPLNLPSHSFRKATRRTRVQPCDTSLSSVPLSLAASQTNRTAEQAAPPPNATTPTDCDAPLFPFHPRWAQAKPRGGGGGGGQSPHDTVRTTRDNAAAIPPPSLAQYSSVYTPCPHTHRGSQCLSRRS
eukprot:COSAG02_NODE_7705_length_2883_cov_3.485273_1_plen_200_part_00